MSTKKQNKKKNPLHTCIAIVKCCRAYSRCFKMMLLQTNNNASINLMVMKEKLSWPMAASFRHFTTLRNWPYTVVLLSANMSTYRITTHLKDQKSAFFNSYLEGKKLPHIFLLTTVCESLRGCEQFSGCTTDHQYERGKRFRKLRRHKSECTEAEMWITYTQRRHKRDIKKHNTYR